MRLQRLTLEQQFELNAAIRRAARPDADYFIMIGLSSAIASLGLLLNRAAVIIGAMLVAPLITAIIGLGMGIVMGHPTPTPTPTLVVGWIANAVGRGVFVRATPNSSSSTVWGEGTRVTNPSNSYVAFPLPTGSPSSERR